MIFAYDVVLCASEKGVLELELEQWRQAWEKRRMKVSRAMSEYMCLNGTPLACVNVQSAQLPHATEFTYLGSTLHSDGDMSTEMSVDLRSSSVSASWYAHPVLLLRAIGGIAANSSHAQTHSSLQTDEISLH